MKKYYVHNVLTNKDCHIWGDYNLQTNLVDYYERLDSTKKLEPCQFIKLETPMETHFDIFGLECGPFWFPLLQPIFDYIDEYNADETHVEKIQVRRVFSNNGQLDVSLNFRPHTLGNLINDIAQQASTICQYCGTTHTIKPLDSHENT